MAVVEAGSIVAAAERLEISHPSVSNHIKTLEAQVGFELFVRRRGSTSSLTEQGRRLYERAVKLTHEIRLLTRDLAPSPIRPKHQRLKVTMQRALAQEVLLRPICDFVEAEPHVELLLDVGIFEQAVAGMASDQVDLCCVITYGPIPELQSEIIGRERFGFFVSPAHPFAKQQHVTVEELSAQSFVSTRRDGHYGQMVHNLMSSIGLNEPRISYQIQSGPVLHEIAMQGRVVACGFLAAAEPYLNAGKLVEVRLQTPSLFADVHIIWPLRRRPVALALNLAERLRAHLRSRSALA